MIPKLLIILVVALGCSAILDSTGCPTSFEKKCQCKMAVTLYDGFKENKFTVNCTNAGFTNTSMLMDLPEHTEVLIFVGNTIPTLPTNVLDNFKNYDSLETIDMSNNHIRYIQGKSFHKVYNVKTLILDHNDIDIADKDRPRMFSNFENLERLHMTNAFTEKVNASTYLLNLEDIFYESDLTYLKVLHLEQNEIWSIGGNEKVFCELVSLEQILLGDNRLTDFDFRIDCLPDLRYIDLERNMISRLSSEAMTRLDAFQHRKNQSRLQIKLDENPFDCDCRSQGFLEWLKTTEVEIMHWKDYDCIDGYPNINVGKTFSTVQDLRCPGSSSISTSSSDGSSSSSKTSSSSSSSSSNGSPNSRSSSKNAVRDNIEDSNIYQSHRYEEGGPYHGHSSATIGVLSFLLVFTSSLLLAVAYFHRKKMKNVFLPYWDFLTRKIGYTGIANEEAPQEVSV